MLTRSIRRSMKRPEGQALVIAALSVLILAMAVLATVNLGHTINERVRLQNTSDAAAYSMAAMEARAFNFYAFANRTQVSHYVTAMLWQSILSFTYWAEAFLVDVYGVMRTIDVCAGSPTMPWTLICPVLQAIPYLGAVIRVINTIVNLYRKFLDQIVLPTIRRLNPDRFVGRFVVPAYRVMNGVLAAASQATLLATMSHVVQTSGDVIADNDPNVNSAASRLISGALSSCILNRAHYVESNGNATNPVNPFGRLDPKLLREGDKIARAKRVMGSISNATRFACDQPGSNCGPGWVTSRKPLDLISLPGVLGVMKTFLNSVLPDFKWGQTKMLSYSFSRGIRARSANDSRGGNFIRDWKDAPNSPMGMMAQGDAMGSDDPYQMKFGPASIPVLGKNPLSCADDDDPNECWGDPAKGLWDSSARKLPFRAMMETSIWAMSDEEMRANGRPTGGIHWRLVYPSSNGMYPPEATWADRPIGYPVKNPYEARIGISRIKKQIGVCILGGGPLCFDIDVWVANTRLVYDTNHTWEGIVPFSHFEPGQFASACASGSNANTTTAATRRTAANGIQPDFNQPSAFVMLNKTPAEMKNNGDTTGAGNNKPALLNAQGGFTFQMKAPTKLILDNTRKQFMSGVDGLNVVTRAQAYYHRPGNWHEQPNFFNPYWRPRLAAVWQGYTQFPFATTISSALGPVSNYPQKLVTH